MVRIRCILAAVVLVAVAMHATATKDHGSESELRQYLFRGYDKLVRPVRDARNNIVAQFGLSPLSIKFFSQQVLGIEAWMLMKWTDEYLRWEPSGFNNITVLRIPCSEVWKPDIAVYTAASDSKLFPTAQTNVLVYSNGDVMWVPPMSIQTRCPMSHNTDVLQCNLRLGSWTFGKPLLDIQLYKVEIDLSDFHDTHPHWRLKDIQADRQEKFYPCCEEAYPSLDFNLTLVRREKPLYKNEVITKFDTL